MSTFSSLLAWPLAFPFLERRWGHGHLHLFSEGWGER